MASLLHRLLHPATYAVLLACAPKESALTKLEVERVRRALIPREASDLDANGPTSGLFSLSWDFRFVTPQPAARYREALMQALEPEYACRAERRRVVCSRALPGDRFALHAQAHPYQGNTLVKATFEMAAD